MGTGSRVSLAAPFLLKTLANSRDRPFLTPTPSDFHTFFLLKTLAGSLRPLMTDFTVEFFLFVIIFQTTFAVDNRRRISRPLSRRFCKILKFRAITYSTPGLIFITADKKIKNQHFLQVSEDSASFINEPADFDLQTM